MSLKKFSAKQIKKMRVRKSNIYILPRNYIIEDKMRKWKILEKRLPYALIITIFIILAIEFIIIEVIF